MNENQLSCWILGQVNDLALQDYHYLGMLEADNSTGGLWMVEGSFQFLEPPWVMTTRLKYYLIIKNYHQSTTTFLMVQLVLVLPEMKLSIEDMWWVEYPLVWQSNSCLIVNKKVLLSPFNFVRYNDINNNYFKCMSQKVRDQLSALHCLILNTKAS